MLRTWLFLALSTCLYVPISAYDHRSSGPINYRTYAAMTKYLLELNATFPDVVQVSVVQEMYNLSYPEKLQCIVDDETKSMEPCKQFLVHLTNHSTVANDPERPEVFISGALHGDERVGPNAAIELVALVAYATSIYGTNKTKPMVDTQRWLKELVNTRNVLVVPMTNAYGYSHNRREELNVDPNRDYNYMKSGVDCMQTMTSRVVNEIWRDHIFQLAVTFHGGTRAVAYEWGSPDHYLHGDTNTKSEKSPDHMAQFQIGNTLANFAGIFPDGKLYPTGTMNDIVYGVTGGMEDWGYAASWENQFYDEKSQPFNPCEPTTFGGYPKEKTIYNNITNRAFNMLVETSNSKEPEAADLGNYKELYNANVDFFRTEKVTTKFVGHVPRNVRLALMMVEMVQPLVRWVDAAELSDTHTQQVSSFFPPASLYKISTDSVTEMGCGTLAWERNEVATCNATNCSVTDATYSMLQIAWEVLGALTVDSTHVQVSSSPAFEDDTILMETTIQKGTTRRFYEFASESSQAAAPDTMETSLFITCLDLSNVTSDKTYIRAVATVDQDWKNKGNGDDSPSPRVPPQSHLVNARTNPDWKFEWNGHRVKSTLEWTSPIITVDIATKLQPDESWSEAPADLSPSLTSSSSSVAQNASSHTDSEDSKDSDDLPNTGKDHAMESPDEDDEDEKVSSDEASNPTTNANVKTNDEDGSEPYNEESKDSEDSRKTDDDDDDLDAALKSSSSVITPDITATGLSSVNKDTPSSLLQFGYVIMSFCAMIIVVTLAYLYRRVFQRARQPYVNIEQTSRATINSIEEQDDEVDDDDESDENEEGPRISRHAQSSRSVM
ncbi:hypothetical protein DD237_005406 [Peronospora effusa]|uniref:Peptidase M14 domain-containing protein n=1 Tax=Peronospora effusa TaxID=542832 RepID=A0A3R7W1T4_9STRA|nr:hypothetical protein DD237_005406 [Peronospora effusa]